MKDGQFYFKYCYRPCSQTIEVIRDFFIKNEFPEMLLGNLVFKFHDNNIIVICINSFYVLILHIFDD